MQVRVRTSMNVRVGFPAYNIGERDSCRGYEQGTVCMVSKEYGMGDLIQYSEDGMYREGHGCMPNIAKTIFLYSRAAHVSSQSCELARGTEVWISIILDLRELDSNPA